MRDIKRIYRIVKLLTDIWEYNPDLRFGQLIAIINAEIMHNHNIDDVFYVEDNVWEHELERYKREHSMFNFENSTLKNGDGK